MTYHDDDDPDDWSDDDDWGDDDYQEFIEREFPGASSSGISTGLPAIWKYTAWGLLLCIVLAWTLMVW